MSAKCAMTRRRFMQITATALAALVAACAPKATPTPPPAKPAEKAAPAATQPPAAAAKPSKYQQNPIWDDLVKQGKLPPVEERLPAEPLVVDRTGKYGGILRTCYITEEMNPDGVRYITTYFMPLRLSANLQSTVPNHFKEVQVSENGRVFTCYMRKGMKWSDGHPYTADDWVFWYEDIVLNKEIRPRISPYFRTGDDVMKLTKIDDYTFRVEFAKPKPSFPMVSLAHTMGGIGAFRYPKHYLSKFHIKYNPNVAEEAKKAGADTWFQYFTRKMDFGKNPELPTLGQYMVDRVVAGKTYFKPNPYFIMVDKEGKQLPYFDGLTMIQAADVSVLETNVVTGQLDYVKWSLVFAHYQTYKDAEEKGNYNVVAWKSGLNAKVYSWNLNYPDPEWRKVFQDVRFRRAMSVALNRDEINRVCLMGLGRPAQLTAHKTSRAYKEAYEKAWAQYDPKLANQLLDEMGLKWDAKHEVRLLPDGRPMEITFLSHSINNIDELCIEYWKAIGVRVIMKATTRTLLYQARTGNQEMMSNWGGDEIIDVLLCRRPKWFAARYGDETVQAPLWALWYESSGKQGEEPPSWYKPLYEWFDKYAETDSVEWLDKILASNAENLWTIGTVVDGPSLRIHSKDLRNVMEMGYNCWDTFYGMEGYYEAWYYENPEKHKL